MNILLKGWSWNYLILQTFTSMSSFPLPTHPISFPSFQKRVSCSPWQCLSFSLYRCQPIFEFLHNHKERAQCKHVCYQPSFPRIQSQQPFVVPCRTGMTWDDLPAASQQTHTVCTAEPASSPDKLLSKLWNARLKQRKMWVQYIQTWHQSEKSIR